MNTKFSFTYRIHIHVIFFLNNTLSKKFQITKKNVHEFNFFSDCNYIQDLVRSLKIYMYNVGQER